MAKLFPLQIFRGTAANWTSNDPTLLAGEFGFETDTGRLKIGDGSTAWTSLLYATSGRNKLNATTAPGTSNDNTEGYTVGSDWVDVTGDKAYKCVDASTGAAVWLDTSGSGSGTVTSVAQTVPTGLTVSGTPITSAGTLAISYDTGYQGYTTTEATKLSGIESGAEVNTINSDTAGEPTGSDQVTNVVSLTQAEYDAGSPNASTLYVITDAKEDIVYQVDFSDQSTVITTGTAKKTFYMPFAMTLTSVRATLKTADNALFTINIKEGGTTIFSTKLTIDSGETTSQTAATAAVISDANLADWAVMTIDVDTAGTAAVGGSVTLIGKSV